jgi:hypothetical protein
VFWKPHVALFVNERTLLPVLTPFAPARTLLGRFPESAELALALHGLSGSFISTEREAMRLAKTAHRSIIGMLNEFAFLADQWRARTPATCSTCRCGSLTCHVDPSTRVHVAKRPFWAGGSS